MKVKVRPFFNMKKIIGKDQIEINLQEGSTILDLLLRLEKIYGDGLKLVDADTKGIRSFYRILLDGFDYRCIESRQHTNLLEGSTISLFPPIAGGNQLGVAILCHKAYVAETFRSPKVEG